MLSVEQSEESQGPELVHWMRLAKKSCTQVTELSVRQRTYLVGDDPAEKIQENAGEQLGEQVLKVRVRYATMLNDGQTDLRVSVLQCGGA